MRHQMAYIGYEPQRETIKYRCPARHEGWTCPHDAVCNAGKSYGKTVRVDRTIDLRRFPPIPRATKKFERLYNGRTSVERVNARLKIFWGVDDGNLVGARRFHAMVGAVLIVHAGLRHAAGRGPATRRHVGQAPSGADPKSAGATTRRLKPHKRVSHDCGAERYCAESALHGHLRRRFSPLSRPFPRLRRTTSRHRDALPPASRRSQRKRLPHEHGAAGTAVARGAGCQPAELPTCRADWQSAPR